MTDMMLTLSIGALALLGGMVLYQTVDDVNRPRVTLPDARAAANRQHLERYRPRVSQGTVCMAADAAAAQGLAPFGPCTVGGMAGYRVAGAIPGCAHVGELDFGTTVVDLLGDGNWDLIYAAGRQGGDLQHQPTGRAYPWTAPDITPPGSVQYEEMTAALSLTGETITRSRSGEGAAVAGRLLTCEQIRAAIP